MPIVNTLFVFGSLESPEPRDSALYLVRPTWPDLAPSRAAHRHDRCRAEAFLYLPPVLITAQLPERKNQFCRNHC